MNRENLLEDPWIDVEEEPTFGVVKDDDDVKLLLVLEALELPALCLTCLEYDLLFSLQQLLNN